LNLPKAFGVSENIFPLTISQNIPGFAQKFAKTSWQPLAAFQMNPVQIREMCRPIGWKGLKFKRAWRTRSPQSSEAFGVKRLKEPVLSI
jgi:hypothetical protein